MNPHDHQPFKRKRQYLPPLAKAVEEALKRSGFSMLTFLEQMPDGLILLDHQDRVIYLNQGAEQLLNLKRQELVANTSCKLWSQFDGGSLIKQLQESRINQEPVRFHSWYRPLRCQLELIIQPAREMLAIYLRQAEPASISLGGIRPVEHVDPITGLPEMKALKSDLDQLLAAPVEQEQYHALLYIDLDHFKAINDSLGYETGNLILKVMGGRLHNLLDAKGSVYRLYGDKFACFLRQVSTTSIEETCTQLLSQLSQPVKIKEHTYIITPSIGVSLYPRDGQDGGTLLANAESAVFQLKQEGRNRYRFFTPDLKQDINRRLLIGTALHHALHNRQLYMAYQPLICLHTGTIGATEALLRWNHPAFGLISPAEFLPQAEDNGLIMEIGQWALFTACQQTKRWQDQGFPHLGVSVNFSARQLQHEKLPFVVRQALEQSGLQPHHLHIEVTESAMITKLDQARHILNQLKEEGCHIVIDDFGTHYSSLQYLRSLPADIIKLDRSFIRDILHCDKAMEIVKSMIELGHRLQFKVVAEGVESMEQAELLRQFGCDLAQGFLFSPPLDSQQMTDWLDQYT